MKTLLHFLALLFVLPSAADADTFGSGANEFTIDFTTIGNAGNTADGTYGAVGYTYRIGTYEVSRGMIEKYNAIGGGPAITMADLSGYSSGNNPDIPATGILWTSAAHFVNWLNTSKGYSAAYYFSESGSFFPWSESDSGYNSSNPYRNDNAYYFLPSENEWYKAAYYDPSLNNDQGGYWDYATGSDSAPTAVASGTNSDTAVYAQGFYSGPSSITNAGGLSPYGTMAQNGNAWEWGGVSV